MNLETIADKLDFLEHYVYGLSSAVVFVGVFLYLIYRKVRKTTNEFYEKKKNDSNNEAVLFKQLQNIEQNLSNQIKSLKLDLDKTATRWDHTHELEKQRISSKLEELHSTLDRVIEITNKLNDSLVSAGAESLLKKKQ